MDELITMIYVAGGLSLGIGIAAMCAEAVLSLLPTMGDDSPQTDP